MCGVKGTAACWYSEKNEKLVIIVWPAYQHSQQQQLWLTAPAGN